MRTLDKIIAPVNCKFGAPMGRHNIDNREIVEVKGKESITNRIFDCAVPMSSCGAYDKGGAYWGIGKQLRVRYTKDLNFVEFYRRGNE